MLIKKLKSIELKNWKLQVDTDNILWLELNCLGKSTNILSEQVRLELGNILKCFEETSSTNLFEGLNGVVFFSTKTTGFSAGADVNEFVNLSKNNNWLEKSRLIVSDGWFLYNRLEELSTKIPTIALVEGFCFGGALELALSCRYIIGIKDNKTNFALPEVQLGIYPGWGGIKRLPERIGPKTAMNLMLTGKFVNSKRAKSIGLIDVLAEKRVAKEACKRLIDKGYKKNTMSFFDKLLLGPLKPLSHFLIRKQLEKKIIKDQYPAPFGILKLWAKHNGDPTRDLSIHDEMLGSQTARNLLRVYLLREKLKNIHKKSTISDDVNSGKVHLNHIHVIGAGTMGGDIAIWCAMHNLRVTIQDTSNKQIGKVLNNASVALKRKFSSPYDQRKILDNIIPDCDGHGIKKADVIIEAATENLAVKKSIFKFIERKARDAALLCTNTSSIKIEDISSCLNDPSRLVGVHFFNPVFKMPLVEIIESKKTDKNFFSYAFVFAHKIKKLPLPVKSSPGFLVNAVLMPYLDNAMRSIDSGIKPEEVDFAMKSWGMPMGPIELVDIVGLDIVLAVGKLTTADESVPSCLTALTAKNHFGKKSGEGFYKWKKGQKVLKNKVSLSKEETNNLAENLIQPLIVRTRQLVEEGIVDDEDLADAGVIFGTGFAPFRGGPLHSQHSYETTEY